MEASLSPNPCTRTLAPRTSSNFLEQLARGVGDLSRRKKFLVGVSGGKDSVALLHGLVECGFRRLVICHLDHQLRGGVAAADSAFVCKEAARLGLPFIRGGQDVATLARNSKVSIETAARQARFQFFSNCARLENCRRLFLAHHREDQVETILHHLFRGSGRRGLGGMREHSYQVVGRRTLEIHRPMLEIDRDCIEVWLEKRQLAWREDATNLLPSHTRNRIRHQLIPQLGKILGRNYREPLLRLSKILREEDEFLDQLAAPKTKRKSLPANELATMPPALARRVVLGWLRFHQVEDPGFLEVSEVLKLTDSAPGSVAKVNLPGGLHARRTAGKIYLESPGSEAAASRKTDATK